MNDNEKLSTNDAIVMEVIWQKGEVTNAEVLEELKDKKGFTRDTVKTYIRRLREKMMVGVNQISPKRQKYFALISKKEYLAYETSEYLSRNYDDLTHMVASLVENEKISDEEIENLEAYIRDLRNNK